MNLTEFCETRVLPVVMAFACGVLVMGWAEDARVAEAQALARRAVDIAVQFRALCSDEEPSEELAFADPARLAEGRR